MFGPLSSAACVGVVERPRFRYHPWVETVWARFGIKHTVVKVALDQMFAAPVFSCVFLGYSGLAEGLGMAGARARIEQQLPLLWQDSVYCWGVAHLVTFNLPIPVRVLWQDVVRLYFGTMMSLRGNAAVREVRDSEPCALAGPTPTA